MSAPVDGLRLVVLGATGDPPLFCELHPRLTVVLASPFARQRVVDALAAAVAGQAPAGVIEAHGVRVDVDRAGLALLDVPAGVELVLRAGDLPADASAQSWARAEAARARRDEIVRSLDGLAPSLASAGAEAAAAEQALAGVEDDAAMARATLAEMDEQRMALELRRNAANAATARARVALIEAEGRLDRARSVAAAAPGGASAGPPDIERMVLALEAATILAEVAGVAAAVAEAEHDALGSSLDAPSSADEALARLRALGDRRAALTREMLALDRIDPAPVLDALSAFEAAWAGAEPDTEARALASALEAAAGDVAAHAADMGRPEVTAAAEAVREASEALVAAERAARPPGPSDADRAAIEELHDAVLEARERADRRVGGGGARKALGEADAALGAMLARFGYVAYADFVMGGAVVRSTPDAARRVDAARGALREAEAALAQLRPPDAAGVDAAHRNLAARRAEAVRRLGVGAPDAALVAGLRALRRVAPDVRADLAATLRRVGATGAATGAGGAGGLVERAHAWLASVGDVAGRRAALRAELDEVERCAAAEASEASQGPVASVDVQAVEASRAVVAAGAARWRGRHAQAAAARRDAVAGLGAARSGPGPARPVSPPEAAVAPEAPPAPMEEAEAAVEAARAELDARATDLGRLDAQLATAADERAAIVLALAGLDHAGALARAEQARDALARARHGVAALEADLAHARAELAEAEHLASAGGAPGAWDEVAAEVEYRLLARVSAHRSLSYAGAVPLVLDDALRGLDDDHRLMALGRLDRLSDAIQVVYLTDDPVVLAWAGRQGRDRVAVTAVDAGRP